MLKKLLSLLLALTLLTLSLTSCSGSVEKRMAKADEHFRSNSYTVNIGIGFVAPDEIAAIFDELKTSKTTAYFSGANFGSTNELTIKEGENVYTFTTMYTSVNGAVYKDVSYTENKLQRGHQRSWAQINSAQSQDLAGKVCLVGGVNTQEFTSVSESKVAKREMALTYTGASDATKEALEGMIRSLFEGALDGITAKDASLIVTLYKNCYKSAVVVCSYDIVLGGTSYEIEATVRLDFTHSDDFEIYHPEDVSSYEQEELDEILPA